MIAFALPEADHLLPLSADDAPGLEVGRWSLGRFANGELHVELEDDVSGAECAILGAFAPPSERMLALLLLADTLKRHGAVRVTAAFSYLGYARQDRLEPHRSLAAAWLGELLRASGVDAALAVDLHSPDALQLFPMPLVSLSPARIFADALGPLARRGLSVVAPDEGAIERCRDLAGTLGIPSRVAHLEKKRIPAGIRHGRLVGPVGRRVIVLDDILDTGQTLVSCCRALKRAGVVDISVLVTHGLFTGTGWEELWSSGVRRVCCTDSVPAVAVDPPPGVTRRAREVAAARRAHRAGGRCALLRRKPDPRLSHAENYGLLRPSRAANSRWRRP